MFKLWKILVFFVLGQVGTFSELIFLHLGIEKFIIEKFIMAPKMGINVISSNPSCTDGNARIATEPLTSLSNNV